MFLTGFTPLEKARRKTPFLTGFTLVEVLVSSVILSLALVLIFQALFISLEAFNYYYDYITIASWVNEKTWEAQDAVKRTGGLFQQDTEGELKIGGDVFNWNLLCGLINEEQGLYQTNIIVTWKAGKRTRRLSRIAYTIRDDKEK